MEKASSSKRLLYDAAFRAKALRLASESCSTLAAARALNINAKPLYQWQKATQQPRPTDPQKAAEMRSLRMQVRRQAQELEILKMYIIYFCISWPCE